MVGPKVRGGHSVLAKPGKTLLFILEANMLRHTPQMPQKYLAFAFRFVPSVVCQDQPFSLYHSNAAAV